MMRNSAFALLLVLGMLLAGCDSNVDLLTRTVEPEPTATLTPDIIGTEASTATPSPTATSTLEPTATEPPTQEPTPTNTPEPTPTQILPGTQPGTPTPGENFGGLLENGSFEFPFVCQHYDVISGCVPLPWAPIYSTGIDFDDQSTEYLPPEFIPVSWNQFGECFINQGGVTIELVGEDCPMIYSGLTVMKIFKGYGSFGGGLTQEVNLVRGTYRLTGCVFPDPVISQSGLDKVYPSELTSDDWYNAAMFRMFGGFEYSQVWDGNDMPYGEWSCFSHDFEAEFTGPQPVGFEYFGRWGFPGNGAFFDAFVLLPLESGSADIMHTVVSGNSWWGITALYCGDGNLWPQVRAASGHTGSLIIGQQIRIYCP